MEEMDKFLEKYNFPKLDQEEIENLNRPITSMDIETVIRNLPANMLQSCPTLCNPIDGSPPGSPVPGILQARTLEWVAISFSTV